MFSSFSHQLNGGADVPLTMYKIQLDHMRGFQSGTVECLSYANTDASSVNDSMMKQALFYLSLK